MAVTHSKMTTLRDVFCVLCLAILTIVIYNFGPSIFRNIPYSLNSESTLSHVIHKNEEKPVVQLDINHTRSEKDIGGLRAQKTVGRLPDAIIIGSKKAGTSTFKKFLARHPDICMAEGEPTYFNSPVHLSKGLSWYRRQFPDCEPHQIQMEKTPGYIVSPTAAKDIHAMNSTIKLLLILRDPTKRLISDYVEGCSNGPKSRCTGTFQEMVMAPNRPSGIKEDFKPVTLSLYVKYLRNYLKFFPLSQIHIIDGEAFVKNPVPELKKAEKFLNIRPYLTDSLFSYNEAKGFFCHVYENNVTDCLPPRKGRKDPYVSPEDLKILQDYYRPFNEELFKLIGKRFAWD